MTRRTGLVRPALQRIGPYGPYKVDPYFAFSNFAAWGEGHNAGFEACVEACRGARCAFDVGAHIGLVTLPMSEAIGHDGRVVAFEPADANAAVLEQHVCMNGMTNVEVVRVLVGASVEESIAFYETDEPSGMNSVVSYKDNEYRATRRSQVTIDSFCTERGLEPDVIKIDVEGAELDVLQGARATLGSLRPKVFLSVHPELLELRGQSESELRARIADFGYTFETANGAPVDEFVHGEYILEPVADAGATR